MNDIWLGVGLRGRVGAGWGQGQITRKRVYKTLGLLGPVRLFIGFGTFAPFFMRFSWDF